MIWESSSIISVLLFVGNEAFAQQNVIGSWQGYFIDVQQRRSDKQSALPPWVLTLKEDLVITIDQHKLVVESGGTRAVFDLELRATANNTGDITLSVTDEMGKTRKLSGIYKLDGNKLAICLGVDSERPKTFEIKHNEEKILIGLEKK
jgi:uncharacterized protein (TIGR03067 family)